MTLPKWALDWLTAEHIAESAFISFFEGIAAKVGSPELLAAVVAWLTTNVQGGVTPEKVWTFAMRVVGEYKSGAPGYNPDAAGLV